jgi:hypothetical protein
MIVNSKTEGPQAARAARGPLRALLGLAIAGVCFFGFATTASADQAISQSGQGAGQTQSPQGLATDFETGRLYVVDNANHRIDVFEQDGSFAFAFGWGVADGEAQLETCGPAASPPTATCLEGLAGGGAGEFENPSEVAVDNDASSPSRHDIYVLERNGDSRFGDGYRVQKFDPEGHFLLAFGGGVITGGATGTGNLSAGSTEITGVQVASRTFEAGQEIESPGKIPAGTKILALGPGTITLSKPAIASATAAALSVAEGAGHVPVNEVVTLVNTSGGGFGPPNVIFSTPNPSPSRTEIGGSISPTADAAELQAALEALPNIGPGNVKVTGENVTAEVHEYTIEFTGARFADTNVWLQAGSALGGTRDASALQNGAGAAEVCTAAIAASCSGGIQGSGHGQFDKLAHLALGPGGAVYVADCVGNHPEAGGCQNRVQKFEPSGAFVEQIALPQRSDSSNSLAVNSSGDFYVSYNSAILEYDPSGSLIDELPVALEVGAVAIGPSDELFAAENNPSSHPVIAEYDSAGNTLRRFGYDVLGRRPAGLAPALGSEAVYSSEGESVIRRDFPAPGPIVRPVPCSTSFLGNAKATLLAEVNPEGKATTVQFQYVDQKSFEEEGGFASPNTKLTAVEAVGSDFFIHAAHGQASLAPETSYRCRVIATDSESHTVIGEEGAFTTKRPLELGATTVSEVGTEDAKLNAEVNPLGIPTTGFFEYVEEATYLKDTEELGPEHGFDHATKAPDVGGSEEPLDYGAEEKLTTRSVHISGLKPATAYRFRIVAEDPFPAGHAPGPATRLRTFSSGEGALPDDRGWELVSPADKNSGDVFTTIDSREGDAGGLFETDRARAIQAAAGSGEAVTYTSWTSFGEAESAPPTSQYLSKRTASGWQTEGISPRGFQGNIFVPPYMGFSPDLRFGAFKLTEPSLSPECPEGREGFYLRESDTGALRCLTPEVPAVERHLNYCFIYGGASEDGSRVFFKAEVPYANAPAATGNEEFSLYEWHEGQLRVLSVLPGQSEPVAPTRHTEFGARLLGPESGCQTGNSVRHHAISADGTKAIWTYVPKVETEPSQLLDRIDGAETVQLDAKQSGNSSKPGNGVFWAASKDGSVVYFTDENKLISQVKAETGAPDLYRYDFSEPLGQRLTDLTSGTGKGTVPGNVQGVLGASDDGSLAYFVAKAALTSEANEAGQHAEAGGFNLYLYDANEDKTSFIATLSGEDNSDWETQPKRFTVRVTPDGEHLAFFSTEARKLAGYDNTLAADASTKGAVGADCRQNDGGGLLCPEAFLYDADSGKITCASCNPSGARPLGPTLVQGWTNMSEGPRFLSDDGKRLFFESFDPLSDTDKSPKRDVYEFELAGEGSCTSEDLAYDPASDGCHFLISSGKSEDESYFLDASSDGRDAFFTTRSKLVGWDTDEHYDVYDAREGGGFPEPPLIEEPCRGEACLAPTPAGPPPSTTSTPHFQGSGNLGKAVKPRCPKGKRAVHSRSGKPRCVKPRKPHGHHKKPHGHRKKGGNR